MHNIYSAASFILRHCVLATVVQSTTVIPAAPRETRKAATVLQQLPDGAGIAAAGAAQSDHPAT